MYMSHAAEGPATVGVAELRQNLSVYLRRIAQGERLIVTDRNRPVAELGPVRHSSSALDQLVAEGKAIPPKRRGGTFTPIQIPGLATSLSDALLAQRAEERW